MKFLITGGAGFIGSCLIGKLNQMGLDSIIAADIAARSKNWKNLEGKFIKDYIDKDKLLDYLRDNKLKEDIDIVIHFGACTSTTEKDVSYLTKNNYLYSKELAQWALSNGKRFLYASSAATYGAGEHGYYDDDRMTLKLRPLNEYGRSKQLFDLWVIENKLQDKVVGFKFFNVYGPNEYHKGDMRSMVNKGYYQIKDTGKIRLFKSHRTGYKDGEQCRDFIYVKDALEIVCFFLEHPETRGIFNVGSGQARTWNDLAHALFSALNMKPNIEYFDMDPEVKGQYQYYTEADPAKLREAGCPYRLSNFNHAIKDYVGYLESGSYL